METTMYKTELPGQDHEDDNLQEIFHETTKFYLSKIMIDGTQIISYLRSLSWTARSAANFKLYPTLPGIPLLAPTPLDAKLGDTLLRRASGRKYERKAMPLQQLSNLLFYSAGVTRKGRLSRLPSINLKFRPYPSGGGLYPLELYAILLNVEGIEPSIVHYDPIGARLDILGPVDHLALKKVIWNDDEEMREKASAIFIITGIPQRSTVKYGPRGYRFMLMEAGHMMQNLTLMAGGLGLASCCWAGFFDDKLDAMLGIDGVDETSLHMLFVGAQPTEAVRVE
jgi:SagB-type dehydrogenase family enzyme